MIPSTELKFISMELVNMNLHPVCKYPVTMLYWSYFQVKNSLLPLWRTIYRQISKPKLILQLLFSSDSHAIYILCFPWPRQLLLPNVSPKQLQRVSSSYLHWLSYVFWGFSALCCTLQIYINISGQWCSLKHFDHLREESLSTGIGQNSSILRSKGESLSL